MNTHLENSNLPNLLGLSDTDVYKIRETVGWNEVNVSKPSLMISFLKRFWGPSAWMIEAIVALSLYLGRKEDSIIAGVLLLLNAVISFSQENRAEKAVELLRKKLQVLAKVIRQNEWKVLPARELVPGDIIRLRLGDFVPADTVILEGEIQIDQSMLTGESFDIRKKENQTIYSGSIVRRGECTGRVTATGSRTYYGRTIELVETAKPKLHLDEVVGKLVRWLFLLISILLAILLFSSYLRGNPISEILPLTLVLLMGAVPVALPVMFSVSTAVAARKLGENGVLVTRLSAAEDAATMTTLCVDKTGTITQNKLEVTALVPAPGISEKELLTYSALASNAADQDAIDSAIFQKCRELKLTPPQWNLEKFLPFSPETRRTEAAYFKEGHSLVVTKGSVTSVLQWTGQSSLNMEVNSTVESLGLQGYRTLAIASSENGQKNYLGIIGLQDPPRPDSKNLITSIRNLGIRVIMLTGDALPVANAIAKQVGLGEITKATSAIESNLEALFTKTNGLAEVFPETKFHVIETFQSQGKIVGMTGDGINDAPSLKKAEVGIAVSNATDAAKSAASVILTDEGLVGIVDLIHNGRAVYQRILTWVINKVSRTIFKSGFVVIAYFLTGKFVISAMAMLLVVLMTDFAKIALATDRVRTSSQPDTWNIGPIVFLGSALGVLMIIEAMLLLAFGIHRLGISVDSPSLHTFTFLLLLFMAIFSIFSIRERKHFWSSTPSLTLMLALSFAGIIGITIAGTGLVGMPSLPTSTITYVILGSGLFSLILNDFIKWGYFKAVLKSK